MAIPSPASQWYPNELKQPQWRADAAAIAPSALQETCARAHPIKLNLVPPRIKRGLASAYDHP
jgi:hypothetical protein